MDAASQQFFAGPRLPTQQDRGVCRRDLLGPKDCVFQRVALADDGVALLGRRPH